VESKVFSASMGLEPRYFLYGIVSCISIAWKIRGERRGHEGSWALKLAITTHIYC
jgi:hypothetical protein